MKNSVKLTIKGEIAVVTLTNPENFNPLNKATGKELLETIKTVRNDNNIRCLIIL